MLKNQEGSVLIVALGITLVSSILVISALQRTGLQQKMAANLKDKELSFQASEAALKQGEEFLFTTAEAELFGQFNDTNGLYTFDRSRNFSSNHSWSSLDTIEADKLHEVQNKPEYIIEELPEVREVGGSLRIPKPVSSDYYRITAKSGGGTGSANTVLQVIYKK